jgi:hypothetical protein
MRTLILRFRPRTIDCTGSLYSASRELLDSIQTKPIEIEASLVWHHLEDVRWVPVSLGGWQSTLDSSRLNSKQLCAARRLELHSRLLRILVPVGTDPTPVGQTIRELLPDPLGRQLDESAMTIKNKSKPGLCLIIEIERDILAPLHRLQWELLKPKEDAAFYADCGVVIVRRLPNKKSPLESLGTPQVTPFSRCHLLGSDEIASNLSWYKELKSVGEYAQGDVHRLDNYGALESAALEGSLLHIVGHGRVDTGKVQFSKQQQPQGPLAWIKRKVGSWVFWRSHDTTIAIEPIDVAQFCRTLGQEMKGPLQLLYFNACWTGKVEADDDVYGRRSSLQGWISDRRLARFSILNSTEIKDKSALLFADAFYKELIGNSGSFLRSLFQARKRLMRNGRVATGAIPLAYITEHSDFRVNLPSKSLSVSQSTSHSQIQTVTT